MIGKLLTTVAPKATAGAFPYSAVLPFLGGLLRNDQARSASARQMAFQQNMSNTSYQRAMADMKKAGLNPILAGKVGGASTPTGSTYQPENIGAGIPGAITASANAQTAIQNARLAKQNADYFARKPYGSAVLNARPMNILLTELLERNPQLMDELSKTVGNSSKNIIALLNGDLSGLFAGSSAKDLKKEPPIKLKKGNMPIKKSPIPKVKIKKDRWDIRLRQWGRKKLKGDFKK